jgi:hypothetical protein
MHVVGVPILCVCTGAGGGGCVVTMHIHMQGGGVRKCTYYNRGWGVRNNSLVYVCT